jgi:hypothetical protein
MQAETKMRFDLRELNLEKLNFRNFNVLSDKPRAAGRRQRPVVVPMQGAALV